MKLKDATKLKFQSTSLLKELPRMLAGSVSKREPATVNK